MACVAPAPSAGPLVIARKDVAMTGKDAPPEVRIRSYRDFPICDVVVVKEKGK